MENRNIRINIIISMIARGLAILISFAYTSIILNYLGEELYGVWAIVLNIISMIYYFDIGVGNGLRNKLTESETNGDHEQSSKYVSTGYVAVSIISLIFCSLLILVWNLGGLSAFFNFDVEFVNTNLVVTISLLFLLVNFIISLNKTIIYAKQKPGLISIAGVIGQVFQLVAVLLLWKLYKADVVIVSIVYGSLTLVENIVLWIYIRVKYPYLVFNPKKVRKNCFKPLMTLGIMFFIMQISTLVLNTTDNLLISRVFQVSEVTPYNVSYKVFYLFVQVHGIIIMPMWSAFTEAKEKKDYIWMKDTMRKVNIIAFLFAIVAVVLIFVFKPLAYIWLRKELDYNYLIPLMATYVIFTMFANNYASFLCGVGEVKVASLLALVQAILNIPLSIVLAKYTPLGINGIIVGSISVMFLSLVALPINYHIWINKRIKEKEKDLIENRTALEYEDIKAILPLYGKRKQEVKYTVYIPTYMRYDLLKEAIDSAINQNVNIDYEILVIDNNPDEKETRVLDIVKSFNSDKIVYYKNEANLGMVGNWNRASKLAKGKYIIHLGDDDLLSNDYLSVVDQVIKDSFYGVLGVGYIPFSESPCTFDKPKKATIKTIKPKDFFLGRNINITGMLYSKTFFDDCGGFLEDMYPMADTYFIGEAAKANHLFNLNAILAGYRKGDQNTSLKDDTLESIITKYHLMRRGFADTNSDLRFVFKHFEAEFLDSYIDNAENYWGKTIDKEGLSKQLNVEKKPTKMKKLILKAYSMFNRIDSFFNKKYIRIS